MFFINWFFIALAILGGNIIASLINLAARLIIKKIYRAFKKEAN